MEADIQGSHNYFITKVEKLSEMGYFFHSRLLKCSDGILSYYGQVPKDFSAENQVIPEKYSPKMSIYLKNIGISEVSPDDIKKNSKLTAGSCFKVTFTGKSIQTNKKLTEAEERKEHIWYFNAANTEEKVKWINVISQEKNFLNRRRSQLEGSKQPGNNEFQDEQSLLKDKDMKEAKDLNDVKDKSEKARHPMNMEEDKKIVNELSENSFINEKPESLIKDFQGKKQDNDDGTEETKLALQEIEKIHINQQELFLKKQNKESSAWNLKFQKYISCVMSKKLTTTEMINYSEKLIDHVGKFKRTAIFFVRLIINEMYLPLYERKFKPLNNLDKTLKILCFGEDEPLVYYLPNKLIIKITTHDKFKMYNNTTRYAEDTYIEYFWKSYGREFNANDTLFDALFVVPKINEENSNDIEYKLRVPLSCIVDFLGFRALVYGFVPINTEVDPMVGFNSHGKYMINQKRDILKDPMARQLSNLADVLNLQEHNFTFKDDTQSTPISLSPLLEVRSRDIEESAEETEKESDQNQFREKNMDFHNYELDYNEDIYYILKASEIFPVNYNMQEKTPSDKYFRPEFVKRYDKPMRSDILNRKLKQFRDEKEKDFMEEGMIEIAESRRFYESTVLQGLISELDSLEILPIDSESLIEAFHSSGVNMSSLGTVARLSTLSHVREICIVEMIARTCKKEFNIVVSEIINNMKPEECKAILAKYGNSSEDCINFFSYKDKPENYVLVDNEEINYFDKIINDGIHLYIIANLKEYLDLILKDSKDHVSYMNDIIIPKASKDYSYPIEMFETSKINMNALFFSLVYHLGIEFNINDSIKLEKDDKIYDKCNIYDILGRSSVYKMKKMPYNLFAENYKEYRFKGERKLTLEALRFKIRESRAINEKEDSIGISELAEILLEVGAIEEAIIKATEGLKLIKGQQAEKIKFLCVLMRAHCSLKDNENFKIGQEFCTEAIKVLTFHWGPHHPLHATIYSIMANLMIDCVNDLEQATTLYKAALMCCTRVLGPNHLKTAEIFMEFGRLYDKKKNKDLALTNVKNAYLIYNSVILDKKSILIGNAAFQLAAILESQRKFKEASPFISRSTEIYLSNLGRDHELYITSLWLFIIIEYALKENTVTLKLCKDLVNAIKSREVSVNKKSDFDERIEIIKENCVVTTILVYTRSLTPERKRILYKMTEKVYYDDWEKAIEAGMLNQTQSTKSQFSMPQDTLALHSLTELEFNSSDRSFLNNVFEENKSTEDGIKNYYERLINSVEIQYKQLVPKDKSPLKPKLTNDNYSINQGASGRDTFETIVHMLDKKDLLHILVS